MEIKTFSPKNHKIKALIYWPSWSWKTSFWWTAENVLFASAENGLLSIADKWVAYMEIKSLNDLEELRDFLKKEKHDFETLVIDSITEISDIIKNEIEKRTWKKMQIQDWWELSSKIEWIIKDIKDIDINVIVIAQELNISDEDKIQKIVPSLNWKSSTKICYYMDIVWYIYIDKSGKRTMITWVSEKLLTKDRTWKIGNDIELNFESWKKLVSWLTTWEEKVLYKTLTKEELSKQKKIDLFSNFYDKLKQCKTLEWLKTTYLDINKNKNNLTTDQHKQLAQLKDDMKLSLEKQWSDK